MPLEQRLRLRQQAATSAAAAHRQPPSAARAALATADHVVDGGVGNQTLTQVPLNQRLPRIGRRKPSTPPTRLPAAAAANIVSEPAQPPRSVVVPPTSTAAAGTEQPACLPRSPPVMQNRQPQPRQPQPQQADIPRPSGSATTHSTLPLVPLHQQQQQQTAMAPPAQASSACAGIGPPSCCWGQCSRFAGLASPPALAAAAGAAPCV